MYVVLYNLEYTPPLIIRRAKNRRDGLYAAAYIREKTVTYNYELSSGVDYPKISAFSSLAETEILTKSLAEKTRFRDL